jgi:hypothetical protein
MKVLSVLCLLIVTTCAQADGISNQWVTHFYQTKDLAPFTAYWATVVADHMLGDGSEPTSMR